MFVPFLSKRSPKGGGGGGRASSAGKSSSSGKGSSSSSSKASSSISGTSRTTSVSSKGGGKPSVIAKGNAYAGRYVGGGTRSEIYGTQVYGSGYPGYLTSGVAGRNFPFGFLPLVFTLAAVDVAMYSLAIQEYGLPESTVRFGGPLAIATFQSKALSNVSFSLYADTSSLIQIIPQVNSNCSSLVVPANYTPVAVLSNVTSALPSPGSVIQYYRSSSAALLLESYNNTAAWTNTTTEDTPLPTDIDPQLLECLNSTIAAALPILDTPPGLDENDKFAISMGCIVGFGLLVLIWCQCRHLPCCTSCRSRRNINKVVRNENLYRMSHSDDSVWETTTITRPPEYHALPTLK